MNCPNCGAEVLSDNEKFCRKCGIISTLDEENLNIFLYLRIKTHSRRSNVGCGFCYLKLFKLGNWKYALHFYYAQDIFLVLC